MTVVRESSVPPAAGGGVVEAALAEEDFDRIPQSLKLDDDEDDP